MFVSLDAKQVCWACKKKEKMANVNLTYILHVNPITHLKLISLMQFFVNKLIFMSHCATIIHLFKKNKREYKSGNCNFFFSTGIAFLFPFS